MRDAEHAVRPAARPQAQALLRLWPPLLQAIKIEYGSWVQTGGIPESSALITTNAHKEHNAHYQRRGRGAGATNQLSAITFLGQVKAWMVQSQSVPKTETNNLCSLEDPLTTRLD